MNPGRSTPCSFHVKHTKVFFIAIKVMAMSVYSCVQVAISANTT